MLTNTRKIEKEYKVVGVLYKQGRKSSIKTNVSKGMQSGFRIHGR